MKVNLVCWRGDSSQLAARLNVSESKLIAALRRVAVDSGNGRLIVPIQLTNTGPLLNAVGRLVKPD